MTMKRRIPGMGRGFWLSALAALTIATPCTATVNIVVSTYDGLVVAADSRVTLKDGDKTRTASDYGQKIVRMGSHAAVTFAGTAYLLDDERKPRSISSIIERYKNLEHVTDTTRVSPGAVARGLDTLLTALYNRQLANALRGKLEITICGYDEANERSIYELEFPIIDKPDSANVTVSGKLDSVSQTPRSRVTGQIDVYSRLIKGYDPQLLAHKWSRPVEEAIRDSFDTTLVDTVVREDTLDLRALRYDIRYDLMTLQDAIDFAVFIIRATIEARRFDQGSVQSVGGAIDIAVITADGFQWVQRKKLHGEGSR